MLVTRRLFHHARIVRRDGSSGGGAALGVLVVDREPQAEALQKSGVHPGEDRGKLTFTKSD